jgi:hypothetical protein
MLEVAQAFVLFTVGVGVLTLCGLAVYFAWRGLEDR